VRFPPANLQLRRAQLVLMLAVLLPTVAMTGVGIVMLVISGGRTSAVISSVLVLTFCTSGITGYVLGSVFLGKGASLVRVQNDFVSATSHELRTPLTSIRLLIESLRGDRLGEPEREEVLSLLAPETQRLEQLVGRVLELSRLESGGQAYAFQTVDVRELVEESIAAFDALTLTEPTEIAATVEPGLTITADRAILVRALVNLLTNAWKFTGSEKHIAIEAHTAGRWVEILVTDNGTGIERAEQRAIYEQFRRGRAAEVTGAPGMGLGLAFVRTIARGHRGKLDFTSEPGQTTFRLRLRRRRERDNAAAALPQRATTA
jgi:two-component system phosphate regulon sensor histidine kinase PhoR